MNIHELNKLYRDTFYLEDESVLPFLIANVIASKARGPAVWCYIIGPTSGGKTTLISTLSKIPFVEQISDLTPNTFLSGMVNSGVKTSLLDKLGKNFVVVMKDFTTIMSKSHESQEAIIAQMREIYDGHLVKHTGTGKVLEWGPGGKGTFIMATTEAIYSIQDKFADMGTRAINYVLKPQDRIATTKRSLSKSHKLETEMVMIQEEVYKFVMEKIDQLPREFPPIDEDFEDEIVTIADFCGMCRSVVKRDFRGEKNLALSAEMPTRIARQLLAIAQTMQFVYGEMNDSIKNTVYKVAFDSISKQRKMILENLTKYTKANIMGMANNTNYPPDLVRSWAEDLNMFGVVKRTHDGTEFWSLKPEYRELMLKYTGIEDTHKDLVGDGHDNQEWEVESQKAIMDDLWDRNFD